MKRIVILLSLAFFLFMVAGNVFAGGGGQQRGYVDPRTVQQSINFTGYPMNARNQTISWFIGEGYQPNQTFASAADSPFHNILQEMLGVNIDWIVPIAGTAQAQALNLILASGDLPDVLFGGGLMADAERYIDEGTFHDLSPYMQQWSPAFYRWINTNPAYDKAMKTDSGRYYGYGFFREDGG